MVDADGSGWVSREEFQQLLDAWPPRPRATSPTAPGGGAPTAPLTSELLQGCVMCWACFAASQTLYCLLASG